MEKTIEFTGDLTAFKNEYCQFVKSAGDKQISVKLIFTAPTELNYGGYSRRYRTAIEHTIKSLFFYGEENNCNNHYEPQTKATKVFYVAGGKRRSGYLLPLMCLKSVTVSTFTMDYSADWERIMQSLIRYNINLETAVDIGKHLINKADHIEGFQNDWKRTDKPKLMSFKDIVGDRTIQQMVELATPSQYSKDTKVYHHKKYGSRRDRGITLEVRQDGSLRYYAASEYAGCGNGDYYEMYSPTMAFYTETD